MKEDDDSAVRVWAFLWYTCTIAGDTDRVTAPLNETARNQTEKHVQTLPSFVLRSVGGRRTTFDPHYRYMFQVIGNRVASDRPPSFRVERCRSDRNANVSISRSCPPSGDTFAGRRSRTHIRVITRRINEPMHDTRQIMIAQRDLADFFLP